LLVANEPEVRDEHFKTRDSIFEFDRFVMLRKLVGSG